MKYFVYSRDGWMESEELEFRERFGGDYTVHELTDAEVVEAIMKFGRARITVIPPAEAERIKFQGGELYDRELGFENGYD